MQHYGDGTACGHWKVLCFGDFEAMVTRRCRTMGMVQDTVPRRCYALVMVRTWLLEDAMLW